MASGDHRANHLGLMNGGEMDDDDDSSFTGVLYSDNLATASKEVQRRVRALKKSQLEIIEVESKFQQRCQELEKEFEPYFNAIYEKRKAIVTGEYQPNDDECSIPIVHGLSTEELQQLEKNAPIEGSPSKGVPQFWLYVLKNSSRVGYLVQERDVPVLKFLVDIKSEVHTNPNGFSLHFHFSDNPFFSDNVLKKHYLMEVKPDEDNPFEYQGLMVIKGQGMAIEWRKNMDITQKVDRDSEASFFEFFNPTPKQLCGVKDPAQLAEITEDFEVGQFICDVIIPRAVLYFTGEVDDDADDDFDESFEGDSDENEAQMEE